MSDDEISIASPSIASPMHILKTVEMKVTLSDETMKDLFAAVALHKLMDEKRIWPQQVDQYVTSAREVADAMMNTNRRKRNE